MPELDKLIERMAQKDVQRVVLVNDQAMRLFSGAKEAAGPVVAMRQLQQMLDEISPPHCAHQLFQEGKCEFPYSSSHGTVDIIAERNEDTFKVAIAATPTPQRTQAVLPSGFGIPTAPADSGISTNSKPIQSQRKKGYLPAIGIGAILFATLIALPFFGARQKAAHENAEKEAIEQAKSSRLGQYSAAIKNLANIGLVTQTFPGDRGNTDYVIVLEDNAAFNAAVTELETRIKSDSTLSGSETTGDKATLLNHLKAEAARNSPYQRAIVINKKAGQLVYENISLHGKDALAFPGVSNVVMTFKGMDGLVELHKMALRGVGDLVSYAESNYANAPLSKAVS